MPLSLNGLDLVAPQNNIGGLAVGGLPSGTITTPTLATNAVTNIQHNEFGTNAIGASIESVSITTIGKPVLVVYSFNFSGTGTGGATPAVTSVVDRDNSALLGSGNSWALKIAATGDTTTGSLSGQFIDSPAAGTHTYKLSYLSSGITSFSLLSGSLAVIEIKA
jgi:hypothetical protein